MSAVDSVLEIYWEITEKGSVLLGLIIHLFVICILSMAKHNSSEPFSAHITINPKSTIKPITQQFSTDREFHSLSAVELVLEMDLEFLRRALRLYQDKENIELFDVLF